MMLLERAELLIKEGLEDDFAAAMKERGIPLLASVPGVKSVNFGRGVENTNKFLLLVEWDSTEAHSAFAKTPVYTPFRQVISPYSKGGAMEHFHMN
jgi:heme-degrading monooxygenase HmoA